MDTEGPDYSGLTAEHWAEADRYYSECMWDAADHPRPAAEAQHDLILYDPTGLSFMEISYVDAVLDGLRGHMTSEAIGEVVYVVLTMLRPAGRC